MISPDIISGAGDYILTGSGNKGGGTRFYAGTDISVTFKDPQIGILGKGGAKRKSKGKGQQYVKKIFHLFQLNFKKEWMEWQDKFIV
jgi:hypothetical protein